MPLKLQAKFFTEEPRRFTVPPPGRQGNYIVCHATTYGLKMVLGGNLVSSLEYEIVLPTCTIRTHFEGFLTKYRI